MVYITWFFKIFHLWCIYCSKIILFSWRKLFLLTNVSQTVLFQCSLWRRFSKMHMINYNSIALLPNKEKSSVVVPTMQPSLCSLKQTNINSLDSSKQEVKIVKNGSQSNFIVPLLITLNHKTFKSFTIWNGSQNSSHKGYLLILSSH